MKRKSGIITVCLFLGIFAPAVLYPQDTDSEPADREKEEAETTEKTVLSWGTPEQETAQEDKGDSVDTKGDDGGTYVLTWGIDADSGEEAPSEDSEEGLWGRSRDPQSKTEEDMTKDVEGAYFKSKTLYLDTMLGGGGVVGIGASYYPMPGYLELRLTSLVSFAPYYEDENAGTQAAFTGIFKVNYQILGNKYHTPYVGGGITYTNTYEGAISAFAFGGGVGYEGRFEKIGSLYAELNFYIDTAGYTAFSPAIGWKMLW